MVKEEEAHKEQEAPLNVYVPTVVMKRLTKGASPAPVKNALNVAPG